LVDLCLFLAGNGEQCGQTLLPGPAADELKILPQNSALFSSSPPLEKTLFTAESPLPCVCGTRQVTPG
jgi:hypothetical protein